jgi:peptide/nickel transport system permease protein
MSAMLPYVARRVLTALPTIAIFACFVFLLQKLLPGDPVLAMAGEDRDPATLAALRTLYHLDDPLPLQFLRWAVGALTGDLGESLRNHDTVLHLISQKLPVTLELALLSTLFALAIGVPAGILAAAKKGSIWDSIARGVALWGVSIPTFWFGIVLIIIVAVDLHWLPASGFAPFSEDPWQNIRTMILPSFVLGNAQAGILMRHTRSSMLEVLRQDYVRTARAKGLPELRVIMAHAFRNALGPLVTVTAVLLGPLLAGAVLTEQVFSIPGFGKMLVDAVFNRDYAVVQGVALCTGVGFIMLNLLADIAQLLLNPRLRA